MSPIRSVAIAAALAISLAPTGNARGEEPFEVRLTIRNHRFEPARVDVPAAREIRLVVTNADPTPEEFESVGLKIERVIPGGATAEFKVRPLRRDRNYKFFGEFHPDTAQGELVAK